MVPTRLTSEAAVYEELGRWITRTNAEVEAMHQVGQAGPPPKPQRRPWPRFLPMVDGDISEWPQALAITPTVVTALNDGAWADQTYFLSWDGQAIYLAGDIAATHRAHPPMEQAWVEERDNLSIQLSPGQILEPDRDSAPGLFIYPHEDDPWDSSMGVYEDTRGLMADHTEVPTCRGNLSDHVARHRNTTTVTTRSAGGTR